MENKEELKLFEMNLENIHMNDRGFLRLRVGETMGKTYYRNLMKSDVIELVSLADKQGYMRACADFKKWKDSTPKTCLEDTENEDTYEDGYEQCLEDFSQAHDAISKLKERI